MTAAINEANYRRLIEEGFNQGNLEVADELVANGALELRVDDERRRLHPR